MKGKVNESLYCFLAISKSDTHDTHAYNREDKINDLIEILNSFDANIQFTYEIEENGTIPFLDVLVKRCDDGHFETSVYRKKTSTDLYINWKSHAPVQWKSSTLKGLVKRAILISSTTEAMEQELEHLKQVFCKINDYPRKFVENIVIDELRKEDNRRNNVENNINKDNQITEEKVAQNQKAGCNSRYYMPVKKASISLLK